MPVCPHDVNLLDVNVNTIKKRYYKKNTGALLVAGKDFGREANLETTNCMFANRIQDKITA